MIAFRFFALLLMAPVPLLALEMDNTILLHNGTLDTRVPSGWSIIGHQPTGNRTVVAFQLFENKAEEGTKDSTNLSIATFNLRDTKSATIFVQPLMKEASEGEKDSKYQKWALRSWTGTQGPVSYRIIDARLTHEELSIGIHLRLAWPLLEGNPKGYDEQMKITLESLLESISKNNSSRNEAVTSDQSASSRGASPDVVGIPEPGGDGEIPESKGQEDQPK